MNIQDIDTEVLKKELERRQSQPGIWKVVKYLRDDRKGRHHGPEFIHLIEKDDIQIEVKLVGNIYDKTLNSREPTCSDDDPNWDSDWEDYEDFSAQYFIGKKVEIESFDPFSIKRILN